MTTTTDDHLVHRLTDDTFADIEHVQGQGGIAWVELPDGLRCIMVTDYATIKKIGVHKDISRDGMQHWAGLLAGEVPEDSLVVPWVVNAGPLSAYGDNHHRLRKLMMPAFTKRKIDDLEPAIRDVVTKSLDRMESETTSGRAMGGWLRRFGRVSKWGHVDLREEFCFPVPIGTISALLGVDDDLFPTIRSGADALFDTALSREELGMRFMQLVGAIQKQIDRKRAEPDDSLISTLISSNEGGDVYTDEEIAEVVRIAIVAGYETTVNLLDMCVYQLLTHPKYLDMVLNGGITWDEVIDEVLRGFSTANVVPMRFAVKDVTISGFQFPAGAPILVSFAGAGRDRKVHDRADEFDPTRGKKDHLGFGTGRHRCPGAPLAMLEARIALPMLFDRFHLRLVEDPADIPPNDGIITNGHKRLLVTLEPKN